MTYFQQLISCTDLHAILGHKDLVVLDASISPVGNMKAPLWSWPEHSIVNARRFDLNQDFSDHECNLPHTMPSALNFERAAQALGINQQSQIVVYDDLGLFSAARAWYMFRAMGHKNVAVLDGGLPCWLALNKPSSSVLNEVTNDYLNTSNTDNQKCGKNNAKGNFVAQAQTNYFCDWREVEKQVHSREQLILDARARDRFSGLTGEPRVGVRSGHIPNSKNLPYSKLFYSASATTASRYGLLKSPDELTEIFKNINTSNKPMIMSCGSGVTACILALAAEICDLKQVRVYDGSWSEWGSLANTDVEKG